MNPPPPHASWNRRRRTAPPPTLRRRRAEQKLVEDPDGDPLRTGESGNAAGRQAPPTRSNPGNPRQAGRTIFRGRANPRMCRHGHGNGQRHHIQAASHRKEAHGKSLAAEEGGAARCSPHGWPIPSNRANDCIPPPKARCRTNILAPCCAPPSTSATRRPSPTPWTRSNASIDAKTKADEEREAQEEAAAAAAAQAQSTPAPQQYSYTLSGSASGPGSGPSGGGYHFLRRFPPARPVVPRLRAGRSPRTRTPRDCPAPTRAYERTNTTPQTHAIVDPVVRGTRHRPRVAGGRARPCRLAPRSAIRIRNVSPTPAARCR